MNPKQAFVAGTVALTITFVGGGWISKDSHAALYNRLEKSEPSNVRMAVKDDFLQALGAASEEEVYHSLLQGQSLADIAGTHQKDIEQLIHLQTAELTTQLDARLANGSLPAEVYEAQKAELTEMIRKSVYGETNA